MTRLRLSGAAGVDGILSTQCVIVVAGRGAGGTVATQQLGGLGLFCRHDASARRPSQNPSRHETRGEQLLLHVFVIWGHPNIPPPECCLNLSSIFKQA